MRPLTLDDLLPLDEYVRRRDEFFQTHRRYLERYRRVRIGPLATLVFENRQTILYKLQEVLRVARLSDPARVRRELEWYNGQLPAPGCLRGSLMLDGEPWPDLEGGQIVLCANDREAAAALLTSRPEDRAAGVTHALEFAIDAEFRTELAGRSSGHVEIRRSCYEHQSAPLSPAQRQSLLDDLR